MNRRQFLKLSALGTGILAGCADESLRQPASVPGPTDSSPATAERSPPATYDWEFEPLERQAVDIGVHYAFVPADAWGCLDGSPAVGRYDSTTKLTVVNRHLDLLQGFGVDRVLFRYATASDRSAIERFTEASIANAVRSELSFDLPGVLTSGADVASEFDSLRKLFDRQNYSTLGGSPVISLRALDWLLRDDERGWDLRTALPPDAPQVDVFLAELRSVLEREGNAPFLVGDLGAVDEAGIERMLDRNGEVFNHLDAVTNRPFRLDESGPTPWSDAFDRAEQSYTAIGWLADRYDLDVLPTVSPGVDLTLDRCDDDSTQVQRSPDHLRSMLEAAIGVATADRVRIDSFNDWVRGTQIEPGIVRGEAYGRAYLQTIEGFVTLAAGQSGTDRSVHFVSPDGSDGYVGSRDAPLRTIQEAIDRAGPGDTVHVLPGRYFESLRTRRSGTPSEPITITGPPDAVLSGQRGRGYSDGLLVTHSHIHLQGLTIDGLQNPSNPNDVSSYMNIALQTVPIEYEYLEGLVIKPHAIGNTRGALINLNYVEHVEVGEFRVIGPAGVDFMLGEKIGHFGEIVYVGSPPGAEFNAYDVTGKGDIGEVDTTNDIHIHHIDASAGHYHVDLVDVKAGCSDVTVEYCTSVDARLPSDNDHSGVVHLGGTDTRFRWNRIASAAYNAIHVGNYADYNDRIPHPDAPDAGKHNEIYGNELVGSGADAIIYTSETSEAAQRRVCGNVVDTATQGDPTRGCAGDVPEGDGIGHLGSNSPWG